MAQARTIRFGEGAILLGDGAGPEVFSAICGFTELTQTMQINTEDTEVPDCDDPDAMTWVETEVRSQQMQLSGQGVLDKAALVKWNLWAAGADAGKAKNVRWLWDLVAADGGGYYQGPGILSSFEVTGQRGQKYNVSVTIAISGKPAFTPSV
jgi:hypothetical protein